MFPATGVVVIADREWAMALEPPAAVGAPGVFLDPKAYGDREAYDAAAARVPDEHGGELVCLAGFMRISGPPSSVGCAAPPHQHPPSLLPAFPGLHAHARRSTTA